MFAPLGVVAGRVPNETHRRWGVMQNYPECRGQFEPWPPEKVNELVSIATELASAEVANVVDFDTALNHLPRPIVWTALALGDTTLAAVVGSA